jgi:hypothetical protein
VRGHELQKELALESHSVVIQRLALERAAVVNWRAAWTDFSPGARRGFLERAYEMDLAAERNRRTA